MIRTITCLAASLLLVGPIYAEDKPKSSAPEKKPEAKAETVTKENTEAKTVPANPREARRRELRSEGGGLRGKVTKASLENSVLKLTLDGKDYEFAVGENTHAILRTTEKDGKEVVVGVSLMNAEGRRAASRTRPATKAKSE